MPLGTASIVAITAAPFSLAFPSSIFIASASFRVSSFEISASASGILAGATFAFFQLVSVPAVGRFSPSPLGPSFFRFSFFFHRSGYQRLIRLSELSLYLLDTLKELASLLVGNSLGFFPQRVGAPASVPSKISLPLTGSF